ncbi:ZinT family metal-binding protein [Celeribacter persicus]|uniref:Zinc transport system substrate-binding protein n=1 Tax=Celeribacter persicus TaxID=1651082 RepID=A0A2T5HV13_9RHOB|nr:metal-binding protein ZinT [Celeribacter persicus]PTQ75394.1 zinc transport system substrate-binding protein [Celeribacter persicus]
MHKTTIALAFAATLASALSLAPQAQAHDHSSHAHNHDAEIYKGYFEDSQIADRPLSDWEGDWQSVYPLLSEGKLDTVMAHKAEHGDKSVAEYTAYYTTGYATDVDRIGIDGNMVTFHRSASAIAGQYKSDGYEILTYSKGNRGVRFIFEKVAGDAEAPQYIQFSDHRIFPSKADHYHLYWGDDRAAVLEELTNWPTYYPAGLSASEIATEMMAH